MKKIFVIDWALIPSFLLSLWTGLSLHIAGHGANHEIWHSWAVAHILASLLFLTFTILHVLTHWGWYKGLTKGLGGKSRVTLLLTLLFLLTVITGLALLLISGANTRMGIFHYILGLITGLISLGHIIRRTRTLLKASRRSNARKP